jgi:hypothetical protein
LKIVLIAGLVLAGTAACRAEEAAGGSTAAKRLFNGQDLTGWHADVPERDKNPAARNPFVVRDGMLVSLGTPAELKVRQRPASEVKGGRSADAIA